MTHPDLVCVVPVDPKMSKAMNWDRTLPWQPLLTRLGELTRFAKEVVASDRYVDYTR